MSRKYRLVFFLASDPTTEFSFEVTTEDSLAADYIGAQMANAHEDWLYENSEEIL